MSKFNSLLKAYWDQFTRNETVSAVIKYHAVRRYPKIQRNDPCPCGSMLKYKQCCQPLKRNPWMWGTRNPALFWKSLTTLVIAAVIVALTILLIIKIS